MGKEQRPGSAHPQLRIRNARLDMSAAIAAITRPQPSRLQIHFSLKAPVHRKGDGFVLVGDFPVAADFSQAESFPKPEVNRRAVGLGAGHAIETVGVGDVAVGGDREVADLVADLSLPGGEPFLEVLAHRHRRLQRRSQVKSDRVRREVAGHAFHVFPAKGRRPRLDHAANFFLGRSQHQSRSRNRRRHA